MANHMKRTLFFIRGFSNFRSITCWFFHFDKLGLDIVLWQQNKLIFQIIIEIAMLKKRADSKKKKTPNNISKSKKSLISAQTDKILFKLTGSFFNAKSNNLQSNSHLMKPTNSSTSTPSTKIRNHSKQNFYQTAFHSKKTSETMTPFDYDQELAVAKSRNDFWFLFQIGSGGFGRVWKVEEKRTKTIFAMKEMSKAKIIGKKSVNSILNEKELLNELSNPFIINACDNFQDRENLYLVMEYLRGGDLRYHMCFYEEFDEEQTKFIVGCIVIALEYIHSCNIIHRDLKPENIVFEENGYARLTDFGVARKKKDDNSEETSGTPGYMAPEVICRMNHSFQADYFALGVIIFEMIFGCRPYVGESRKQIRQKILAHQAKIHERELPPNWSPHCADFVNRLLKRNKESRLGYNGIEQIKSHPWLRSINWSRLSKKQLIPPFIPGIVCESLEYQREMENTMPSQINEEAVMLLRTPEVQTMFRSYDKNRQEGMKNRFFPMEKSASKFVRKVV